MKIIQSAFILLFLCGYFITGYANETPVWQGYISSNGDDTESIALEPGSTYVIEVDGTMNFGVNFRDDKQLVFDACYEFNSLGHPDFVPAYRNSLGVSVCKGLYEDTHVYTSEPFVAQQDSFTMSIFDTDYRDNSGRLEARVMKIEEEDLTQNNAAQFNDGFFVVMKIFQPEMEEELQTLDEGQKPSEYLKTLDPTTVNWEPSEAPLVLFIPNAYAEHKAREISWWSEGKKAFIPLSFKMVTSLQERGEQTFEVEGGLLVEIAGVAADYAALVELYPAIEDQGGKKAIVPLSEDGTFVKEAEKDIGRIFARGGPFEPSSQLDQWEEEQYKKGMQFIWEIYEMMGCFVATAIYEVPSAPELSTLRTFRDKVLMSSDAGRRLVSYYYHLGPHWARQVREAEWVQSALRPIVGGISYILSQIDMENEYVQRVFHGVVAVIDWFAEPWLEEKSKKTGLLTPMEVLP